RTSPLFPYTTLFRSRPARSRCRERARAVARRGALYRTCRSADWATQPPRVGASFRGGAAATGRPRGRGGRGSIDEESSEYFGVRSEEHTSELQSRGH